MMKLTMRRVGNYCRVFTNMAECFLDAMITSPNQVLSVFRTSFVTLFVVCFSCMYSRCDLSTGIFTRIYGYMDMDGS